MHAASSATSCATCRSITWLSPPIVSIRRSRARQANGLLSADSVLVEGQALTIPSGVIRSANDAATMKPYGPSEAYGDTSRITPKPVPPKGVRYQHKCGVFAQVSGASRSADDCLPRCWLELSVGKSANSIAVQQGFSNISRGRLKGCRL